METVNCMRCDFRHKDNGNCTAVGGFCTAVAAAHCPLLREYLDTELTPEEVNDAVVGAKLMAKAKVVSAFGVAAERLRELAEADKDGRVVVLPCQSGERVFALLDDQKHVRECEVKHAILDGWRKVFFISPVGSHGDAYSVSFGAFGKTVFLAREEAENALEAMKDGN